MNFHGGLSTSELSEGAFLKGCFRRVFIEGEVDFQKGTFRTGLSGSAASECPERFFMNCIVYQAIKA